MKTVFFERSLYKLITKNDFYYGSCPDIHKNVKVIRQLTGLPPKLAEKAIITLNF